MNNRWSQRESHNELNRKLDHIHELLHKLNERIIPMSAALDRLTSEVSETSTAVDSVLALVEGLAQQIRDAAEDPVKLNALADELDAKQQKIADAVAANTPAPPPPPVDPNA